MARINDHQEAPVIVWFRKDLRMDDNRALRAACDSGKPVIPLYVLEPDDAGTGPLGGAQAWWLHHALTALADLLAAAGSKLVFRAGAAPDVLDDLLKETGANAVFWNRRYDPSGVEIDRALKSSLMSRGIDVASFAGALLHEPTRIRTKTGGPYRVYTPFWRAVMDDGDPEEPVEAPSAIPAPCNWPDSDALEIYDLLPTIDWAKDFPKLWRPGEPAAREKLDHFIDGAIEDYRRSRERTWEQGTSMLSPHLALGEISPRRVWHATRGLASIDKDDVTTFRRELVWREFAYHLLFHNPAMPWENLNRKYDRLGWTDDDHAFSLWTRGLTGFPIVDAGMRQLWRFGTMHNRVRMIAGSFLVKDLMIDWRRGEQWFRDTLVDADPASNAMNWQWVAGCGADAAPFFRIFNPMTQGEKFDAEGRYVREHLPELAGLPDTFLHRPFDAPADILAKAGVTLGENYPKPLVEHGQARDRALAAYRNLKDTA